MVLDKLATDNSVQPIAQCWLVLDDGGKDLYIQQDKFHQQFAADLPKATAELMAAAQRPIAEAALTQVSGAPAWKDLPSYSIFGTADKNIPLEAMRLAALIIEAADLRVPKKQ